MKSRSNTPSKTSEEKSLWYLGMPTVLSALFSRTTVLPEDLKKTLQGSNADITRSDQVIREADQLLTEKSMSA